MINKMVSVIVPLYNAEKWLKLCVKSIIQQTYRDLEILLIDDGSTDSSLKLCDRFQKKDNRIRVIHKSNGGVSVARNIGLESAEGEYLCFVDADDYLPPNAIEIMVDKMVEEELDYCNGALYCINPVHNLRFKEIHEVITWKSDVDKWCDFLDQQEWGPCAKLFRKSIIEKNCIRFPIGIKYGEDTIFVSKYLYYCDKVMTIDENLYYYNQLNQSSASKKLYPDLWKWSKEIVNQFAKLIPAEYQKAEIVIYCFALKHYKMINEFDAIHGSEDNKEEIISLMREAYYGFEEYLNDIKIVKVDDIVAQSVIDEYFRFVRKRDFEGLYEYLKRKANIGNSKVKNYIRGFCGRYKIAVLRLKGTLSWVRILN